MGVRENKRRQLSKYCKFKTRDQRWFLFAEFGNGLLQFNFVMVIFNRSGSLIINQLIVMGSMRATLRGCLTKNMGLHWGLFLWRNIGECFVFRGKQIRRGQLVRILGILKMQILKRQILNRRVLSRWDGIIDGIIVTFFTQSLIL